MIGIVNGINQPFIAESILYAQFNPSIINTKNDNLITLFQLMTNQSNKVKKLDYISELSGFSQDNENSGKSKLRKTDLEPHIKKVFDKAFDELNVPKELRPKLIIEDELKYLSKEEIEAKVSSCVNNKIKNFLENPSQEKIKIFEKVDDPMNMTKEELLFKIKTAVEKYTKNKDKELKFEEIESSILNEYDDSGGLYKSDSNSIIYFPQSYRKGQMSIEEVIVHEALHAKKAILRSRLSQSEKAMIVKGVLKDRIINGEPEKILKSGNLFGPEMMDAPKMSPKMKAEFAQFAEENLFTKNDELINNINKLNQLKSLQNNRFVDFSVEKQKELNEAEVKLKPVIDKLKILIINNPDFVANNGNDLDKAIINLIDYSLSHETRYKIFTKREVEAAASKKLPELTAIEKLEAKESVKDYVDSLEGNANISGFKIFGPNRSEFNQYLYSPEEVLARNTASNFEKKALLGQLEDLKNKNALTKEKEIKILKKIMKLNFQIEYNNIGKQYYNAYIKKINKPHEPSWSKVNS